MSDSQHDEPIHDLDQDDDDGGRGARPGAASPSSSSFEGDLGTALRSVDSETGARPLDLEAVRRRGARRRAQRLDGSRRLPVLAGVIAAACTAGIVAVTVSALPSSSPVASPGIAGPAGSSQPTATSLPTTAPLAQAPTAGPSPTLTTAPPTSSAIPSATTVTGSEKDMQTPRVTVVPLAPGATFPGHGSPDWNPNVVAYEIPDLVTSLSALPKGSELGDDIGQYRLQPTVSGQGCGEGDTAIVAGRQWTWTVGPMSNDLDQVATTVTVTGWAAGKGPQAFRDVVANTGVCRWMSTPQVTAVAANGADEAWAATFRNNGLTFGRAAARVGDTVVGVEVMNPPSGGTAEAQRVLEAVVAELVADHLPGTGR
ncbi:hypothetical protein SAMN06264364_14326 [Quadrisphaera granulorum]|uniref:PknH-like protein n=1 Tax=Quadrisphaera granulorum TaxID=317664 RepID=A0A315ZNY2_9ACTN|nr:hypothetical protein [Quadrisphaera granulorum]PWJ46989.1 hypothetical protein BXY45_14326 [Quadrisphaera granulorum]SZE98985.1 hypothetical protein SAMN06264364_14326 [Quadrisphaera granulorum]